MGGREKKKVKAILLRHAVPLRGAEIESAAGSSHVASKAELTRFVDLGCFHTRFLGFFFVGEELVHNEDCMASCVSCCPYTLYNKSAPLLRTALFVNLQILMVL